MMMACMASVVVAMIMRDDGNGFDAETLTPDFGILSVQDYCEVLSPPQIDTKIEHARAHLAACCQRRHHPRSGDDRLWLSFLSASNIWHPGCWPDRIARILNPNVVQYLCCEHGLDETADGSAGVVVCDWVGEGGDWDLVRCIVGMNARLATRWPRQSS